MLLLADRTYLSRFWTQFEAWLSMQQATARGLVSAARGGGVGAAAAGAGGEGGEGGGRYQIVCVHGAPDALRASLVEEWSDTTASKAHAKLSSKDVQVDTPAV